MKTILTVLIFINCYPGSYAQCNVSKIKDDSSIVYANKTEKIYENEDLENGVMMYHLGTFKKIWKSTPKNPSFLLECFYTYIDPPKELVPRKLKFSFFDGTTITIIAKTELNVANDPGKDYKRRRFFYAITAELLTLLSNQEIVSISFIDNRTENLIVAHPYKRLFIEQLDCLSKYWSSE